MITDCSNQIIQRGLSTTSLSSEKRVKQVRAL